MGEHFDAIVAGHLCLDIIPQIPNAQRVGCDRLLVPGRLLAVGPAAIATGGLVSNTGLVLSKLGVATGLMGKIGEDLFGQAVRQIVAGYGPGLTDGMVIDPAATTSYSVVLSAPGVDRIFLHHAGANDTFGAGDVRYELLERARLFHFGYPPIMGLMYADGGVQLTEIMRRARATGVTTSLDTCAVDPAAPAGRADWRAILTAVLPHVDIFLPSFEEIIFMLRRPQHDALTASHGGDLLAAATPELLADLADELLALGAGIVGLKLGHRGFYLRTAGRAALAQLGRGRPADLAAWAERELWAPCFQVAVVGTTGAGDATIAGFLAALLRGLTPEATMNAAVAVGACNVEAPDALSGIRPWDDTLRRVAAGWPRHELHVDAPGWRFDAQHGLWTGRESA